MGKLSYDDLVDPARWDVVGYEIGLDDLDEFEPDDIVRSRRAQLLMRQERYEDALLELDRVEGPPGSGLRRLARLGLGLYERVLQSEPTPAETLNPIELEEQFYFAFARAGAASQLGKLDLALQHNAVAEFIARTLRMERRLHVVHADILRIRNLMGDPQPEEMAGLYAIMGRWNRRLSLWGRRTLVEMHLARGDYTRAHRDAQGDSALEAFTGMLACDGTARPSSGDHGAIANIAQSVLGGHYLPDDVASQPYSDYARVIRAYGLLRRGHPTAAMRHLGPKPPGFPDQRVYWGGVALLALAHAGSGGLPPFDPLSIADVVHEGVARMISTDGVVCVMRRYMPDALAALAVHPETHPHLAGGLAEVPLLVGGWVEYRGDRIKVPPTLGEAAILRALGVSNGLPTVHAAQESRYRSYLGRMGLSPDEVVNVGVLYRLARTMEGIANGDNVRSARAWRRVAEELASKAPVLQSYDTGH
ncbi:hypothetical protein [Oceanithermus sp.]|uniref:hypothetical protein n=1 Tax=Oceanithermus sp. TaxID=2268145 RepID=UPI00257EF539|nr:hypothetical protein [Oceanithermus sp.]